MERDRLADLIKGVHRKLRIKYHKTGNQEKLWVQHTQDEETLKEYAEAMHRLATEYWQNLSDIDPKTSRIYWTRNCVDVYFRRGGIEKHQHRRRASVSSCRSAIGDDEKIRVLDVGSCYDPFSQYSELDVLAVDLCPAVDAVLQCDFLDVDVGDATIFDEERRRVRCLKAMGFDVVVFSLLLEYLPSPTQRWASCKKAHRLLTPEGLLVIITPDSKAAHSNSKVMKSWRTALAALGLTRVCYEKLLHAHCMAFCKSDAAHDGAPINDEELAAMMYIPQDLQAGVDSDAEPARGWPRTTDEEVADSFSVLPRLDLDDDDDTEEQGS